MSYFPVNLSIKLPASGMAPRTIRSLRSELCSIDCASNLGMQELFRHWKPPLPMGITLSFPRHIRVQSYGDPVLTPYKV